VSSSAPHKPDDVEAQFQGTVRNADGYQYWATSEEDEAAADFGEMADRVDLAATPVAPEQPKRKRNWGRTIGYSLLTIFFGAVVYFGVTLAQVYFAADDDQTRVADAAVVLGAAQFDGVPSPVFAGRLDHALALYEAGQVSQIITTGSNIPGDRFTEGGAGYLYLLDKGVPDQDLIPIVDGGNTWEQLSASALQIEEFDIDDVLLVSDGYHNYRLLDIADEFGIDAYVSPTLVEPTIGNYVRESAAVSIGRIFGYRRLSSLTSE
jgi:vancomycin permeability regulator SanA